VIETEIVAVIGMVIVIGNVKSTRTKRSRSPRHQ
jgi:hypothetical protein